MFGALLHTTPVTEVWEILTSVADTDIDLPTERVALESGQNYSTPTPVLPIDFGTVDFSGGDWTSLVEQFLFKCTTAGGNTVMDDCRLWIPETPTDQWGFANVDTKIYETALSTSDVSTKGITEAFKTTGDPAVGDYSGWAEMVIDSLPGSFNMATADRSATAISSTDITSIGTTEDVYITALYMVVDDGEAAGTYTALTSGFEFRMALRFSFS